MGTITRSSEASPSEWEANASVDRANSSRHLEDVLIEQDARDAEAELAAELGAEADGKDSLHGEEGVEYDFFRPLHIGDFEATHANSLALKRLMECGSRPVMPYAPIAGLAKEVGQDFKENLMWSPAAIRALDEALELYLVNLLADANLCALHRGSACVTPKDLQFARRLRGERA